MNSDEKMEKRKKAVQTFMYDGLTDKQCQAVELLQTGDYTKIQIADMVGVHRNTITEWCKMDRFRAALKECADEKIQQTLNKLKSRSAMATDILWKLANSEDKRVAMEATKYILDRNLGKTTSKIIVDDTQKETKDIDIAAEIEAMKNGENPLDIDF
jgi:predicted DNA-binding protein YlxM (UPF0122 family)